MKNRSLKDYLVLAAKGFGMGSADVVPGVSGGTIAFISGIYEELLDTIKGVNLNLLTVLRKEGLAAAWRHVNGNFLLAVFAGIGISILSMAKLLSHLLAHHPVLLWAFFFGLIVASAVFVGKQVKRWNAGVVTSLLIGVVAAFLVTTLPQEGIEQICHENLGGEASWWFLILSGAVAICAMILPGISGSFILVILGLYETVINAVKNLDLKVVIPFAVGAVIGLVTFSRVVSFLFKKFHDLTIAILTGFMIGSLWKVWPWKTTLAAYADRHGDWKPLVQENVLPGDYATTLSTVERTCMEVADKDALLLPSIGLMIAGFALVFLLERLGPDTK